MLKATRNIWTVNVLTFYRAIIRFDVIYWYSLWFIFAFRMVPVLKAIAAMTEELTVTSTADCSTITTGFHDQLQCLLICWNYFLIVRRLVAQPVLDLQYFLFNSRWEYLRKGRLKLCVAICCRSYTQLKIYGRVWVIWWIIRSRLFFYVKTWIWCDSWVGLHTCRVHGRIRLFPDLK